MSAEDTAMQRQAAAKAKLRAEEDLLYATCICGSERRLDGAGGLFLPHHRYVPHDRPAAGELPGFTEPCPGSLQPSASVPVPDFT